MANKLFEMFKNEGITFVGKQNVDTQTVDEKVEETQVEEPIVEEQSQEVKEEVVQEEVKQDDNEVAKKDNSEEILGLLHKYKELQKLK